MYNVWLEDTSTGLAKPWKTDLNITDAFTQVSFKQDNLKSNQRLVVEEVKTGRVDMLFTKKSTITPTRPMSINRSTGKVVTMSPRPQTVRSQANTRMRRNRNARPSSTRSKDYIGDKKARKLLWTRSSATLYRYLKMKDIDPANRRLASYILSTRRKKR